MKVNKIFDKNIEGKEDNTFWKIFDLRNSGHNYSLYFKKPIFSLANGLVILKYNKDVKNIIKFGNTNNRSVDLYLGQHESE